MKRLTFFCIFATVFFAGCTKPAPGGSVTPIQSAGCAVETAVVGGAASAVASVLSCSNAAAIQASLTVALGNVSLCATPVPSAPTGATLALIAGAANWHTIGDISAGDLEVSKSSVKGVKGVIGAMVCPLVVNTVVGFGTSLVPTSWGCTGSAAANTLGAALAAACIAAVPL